MKIRGWLSKERKYFMVVLAFSMLLGLAMLVQNIIRYGAHESYNPWLSVQYVLVIYLLFQGALPLFLYVAVGWKQAGSSRYYAKVGALSLLVLICYYVISSLVFHVLGFFEGEPWISPKYASYYFGRDALFHLFILLGTGIYVKRRNGVSKKISGTVGRRKVEVASSQVHWIEADDHYLKIHTPQYELLKRSTLDSMARLLEPDFIRVHRKYLVNRKMIVGTEKIQRDQFVVLHSGEKIKVGRSYAAVVRH